MVLALASTPCTKALAQQTAGWGGLYIGLLGVASDGTETGSSRQGNGAFSGSADLDKANVFTRGGGGGVVLGLQFQTANGFIAGLETDWVALRHEERRDTLAGTGTWKGMVAASIRREAEWVSTARLRLGYGDGLWMVQATAGLALASLVQTRTQFEGVSGPPVQTLARFSETDSELPLGWTLGIGGAWQIADGWSLRLDYLHTQFDAVRFRFPDARGGAGANGFNTVQGRDMRNDVTLRMLRFGITYTLGEDVVAGLGQGAPTAAD